MFKNSISYPSVLGAQKNRHIEKVLMITLNICFGLEMRKLIFNYAPFTRGLSFIIFNYRLIQHDLQCRIKQLMLL